MYFPLQFDAEYVAQRMKDKAVQIERGLCDPRYGKDDVLRLLYYADVLGVHAYTPVEMTVEEMFELDLEPCKGRVSTLSTYCTAIGTD